MHWDELARSLPAHYDMLHRTLEHYKSKDVIGLFLGGSLAVGEQDIFSDIDLHVVASSDSYSSLLTERPGFMRSLGQVVCEWSTFGESQLLCLYEAGVVLEVLLHGPEYLGKPRANMKMKILYDPLGSLSAFQSACASLPTDPEVGPDRLLQLWQQVWAWLWLGVGQTLRGEVWEGRDYLEVLRDRAIMPLYRTLRNRRPEGYRRLETWAEPEFLRKLTVTVAPPDTEAVLRGLLDTSAILEELCVELARTYAVDLPSQPTKVRRMVKTLFKSLGMTEPSAR